MGKVKGHRRKQTRSSYDVQQDYFQWLCEKVMGGMGDHTYLFFLKRLHSHDFEIFVHNDENRAVDGQILRDRFSYECLDEDDSDESLNGECTVLEMMIALSERMSDIIEESPEYCFWEMVENLFPDDMEHLDDDHYYQDTGRSYFVDKTIDTLVDRTYKRNGTGGLFPVKKSRKDQRKIEIWYQMMSYLNENY